MKRLLSSLFLAVSLLSIALTPAMTCTPSQQRLTYNSLFSVGQAVNQAYAAYNDQVVTGKATFNPSVAKAYNDFQAGYAVAVVTASNNPNAIAPQNVVDLANAVYAAIKQFTK